MPRDQTPDLTPSPNPDGNPRNFGPLPTAPVLDSLYAFLTDEARDVDSRLDHILEWSDERLWAAKWDEIDDMISYAPYSELDSAVSVTLLLSVRAERSRFPHWGSALLRLEESLLTQGLEDQEISKILVCIGTA